MFIYLYLLKRHREEEVEWEQLILWWIIEFFNYAILKPWKM